MSCQLIFSQGVGGVCAQSSMVQRRSNVVTSLVVDCACVSSGVEKTERLGRVSCLRQLCYHARSRLQIPDTKSCLDEHSARCREPHGSRPLLGAHSTSLRRRRRWVHDHSHLSRVLPKTRKELLAVTAVELHARARDQRSPGPSRLSRRRCVTARSQILTLYMACADRTDGARAKVVGPRARAP